MIKTFVFSVSTRRVGSQINERVTLDLPDDYDIINDYDNIIDEAFEEWLWSNIETNFYVDD
jgi:hypothetical protein